MLSCVVVTPKADESGNCHSHSIRTQHFGSSWKMIMLYEDILYCSLPAQKQGCKQGSPLRTLKIFSSFKITFSFCWLVKKTSANCRINTFICYLIAICSFAHVFIVYLIPAWNRALYKPVTSLVARQPPWEASLDNLNVTDSEVCNLKGEGKKKKSKKKIWASEL